MRIGGKVIPIYSYWFSVFIESSLFFIYHAILFAPTDPLDCHTHFVTSKGFYFFAHYVCRGYMPNWALPTEPLFSHSNQHLLSTIRFLTWYRSSTDHSPITNFSFLTNVNTRALVMRALYRNGLSIVAVNGMLNLCRFFRFNKYNTNFNNKFYRQAARNIFRCRLDIYFHG